MSISKERPDVLSGSPQFDMSNPQSKQAVSGRIQKDKVMPPSAVLKAGCHSLGAGGGLSSAPRSPPAPLRHVRRPEPPVLSQWISEPPGGSAGNDNAGHVEDNSRDAFEQLPVLIEDANRPR